MYMLYDVIRIVHCTGMIRFFSSDPDTARLKKKKLDPDMTIIRNEKKNIYILGRLA